MTLRRPTLVVLSLLLVFGMAVSSRGARAQDQKPIIIGKFVDRERPTFLDSMNRRFKSVLGDKYELYGMVDECMPQVIPEGGEE